ncbi:RadC family protein [Bartonella sp. DGB2]|uniref:RadC family protein n=1 Tax=Bartonella sp. DGB2 TaxID=3388426 RepID=UPI00398FEF4D
MTKKRDPYNFQEPATLALIPSPDSPQGNLTSPDQTTISPKTPATKPKLPNARTTRAKSFKNSTSKHYHGHRERLRKRYFKTGGIGLEDYEYLELLLYRIIPRADTKPLAKALLARFGTLADVLGAEKNLLEEVPGCGPSVAMELKILGDLAQRVLHSQLYEREVFSSWDKVLAYCKAAMAHEPREQLRILYLDKKNALITAEIMQIGTVDHTPVYPREIALKALKVSASAVIIAHNHPAGDPTPSQDDINTTMILKDVLNAMNISLHDHIIIARNTYISFKSLKLI